MLADEGLRSAHLTTAERAIAEGLGLARGRILVHEAQLTSLAARLHRRTGRLGEAVQAARHALQLTEQLGLTAQRALQHLLNAELWLDLGALEPARTDLEVAQTLVPSSLKAYTTQLETLQARLELETGTPKPALKRLKAAQDTANQASPEQRVNHACTLARTHLMLGDAVNARKVLEGLTAPTQLEARVAALKLEAGLIGAKDATSLLEHAPPLEAFILRRALGDQQAERLRQQLAETLEPDLRTVFLEHTRSV